MRDVFPKKNKEQFVWRYHGTRFAAAKSKLYTQQLHGIDDHFRYHGPQLEKGGRCQVEVAIRSQEAQEAWDHYKGFWAKRCNLPLKQMIFRKIILSILISAMISLNTTKLDLDRLNANMMALAPRSLAGRSTIKDENEEHIIKKPQSETMKIMKLGSFEIELDIARLSYWQRIFRRPHHHQQHITAAFGQLSFDADFESSIVNSRYTTFKTSSTK